MATSPTQTAVAGQNPVATPTATNQNSTPLPTNPQGLTVQQMSTLAGQGDQIQKTVDTSKANPGTTVVGPQTGTTTGGQLPVQPTTFQAKTTTPDSTAAENKAMMDQINTTSAKTAAATTLEANKYAGQQVAGYTDSSGLYHPPTTVLSNMPPKPSIQPLMTSQQTDLIKNMTSGDGILSTSNYDAASSALGGAISSAKGSSMEANSAITEMDNYVASVIKSNMDQVKQFQSWANDPNADPMTQMINAKNAFLEQQKATTEAKIQSDADAQLLAQGELNKELEGKARAAANAAGQVGSMVGESYIAAQLQNNQDALNSIKRAETDAIQQAELAYQQGELEVASEKMELAEKRRQQANDMMDKNVSLVQSFQQTQIQRQQIAQQAQLTAMQLKQEGRATAKDYLSTYAKQNLDPSVIPDEVWNTAVSESGGTINKETAKAIYMGSLKDQKASDMESFNKNTQAFYQAASQIKDPNVVLWRPNPDGTFTQMKRSEVQLNPDYAQSEITENGKKYMALVDKNNPTAPPVKIPMGDASPQFHYFTDDFGNQMVFDETTQEVKSIMDMKGNPGVPQSISNTVSSLDASGHTYAQMSGAPTWTQAYPDGSVHTQGTRVKPECGQFVNDVLGTHFADSLEDKIKVCDPTIGTAKNPVKVGDAIVTAEAAGTGHVAIVNKVEQMKDGRVRYTLSESNYKKNKNGTGVVTNTRTMYSDNPTIRGYGRGTKNPAAEQEGPKLPDDNGMSWKVNAPLESPIKTHIGNGVVKAIDQVGSYKDGSPMYQVSVLDTDTNTIHNFSGVKSSELRIGSSWSNTDGKPVIGKAGRNGYSQEIRNEDDSPIQPTGTPLDQQTWGKYDSRPPSNTKAGQGLDKVMALVAKGTLTKEGALKRLKNDPLLGQIMPEAYMDELNDSADQGGQVRTYKSLQTENIQEGIKQKQLREARTVVPAAQMNADPRVKNYRQAQSLMPKIQTAERFYASNDWTGNAPTDVDLLDTYVRMSTGSAVTEAQIDAIKGYQSLLDQGRNYLKQGQMGGFLTPESRQQIVTLAHQLEEEQKGVFDSAVSEYQSMLDANNIDFKLTGTKDINALTGTVIGPDGNAINIEGQGPQAQQAGDPAAYYKSQLQPGEILMQDAQGNYVAVGPNDSTEGLSMAY